MPLVEWLAVWRLLVPLVHSYCAWLQRDAARWHISARRRVPAALYGCERLQSQLRSLVQWPTFEASLARVLEHHEHDAPLLTAGTSSGGATDDAGASPSTAAVDGTAFDSESRTTLIALLVQDWIEAPRADQPGAQQDGAPAAQEAPRGTAGRQGSSRCKLRSRNPYIDAELSASKTYDDTYADLEDFIVTKRGRKY